MELFLIIVGIIVGVLVIAFFASMQEDSNQKKENNKWLFDNGFNKYSNIFLTNDAIGIDYERSKIAVVSKNQKNILDFKYVVSVELVEDGETVSKTNRGSQFLGAAIGAAAFGAVGGIVGGLSGTSRNTNKISKTSINIITKDRDLPFVEIRVFDSVPTDKSSFTYKQFTKGMMPWYARLKAIIEE